MATPIVGCYISPTTSSEQLQEFLHQTNQWFRGPGVLVGELNSRDRTWDETSNRRGPTLRKWAIAHGFTTQRPPTRTLRNMSGSSRVDLCFHRNRVAPTLTVHPFTDLSDHAPVTAELRTKCIDNDSRVPMSVIEIAHRSETESPAYMPRASPFVKKRLRNHGPGGKQRNPHRNWYMPPSIHGCPSVR